MASERQIETVVEVAGMRRDDCLRALGQARHALDQGHEQLAQLQGYANESQARWNQRASQGVTAQLLHHHRQFMARIDEAARFQEDVIKRLEAEVLRCEQGVQEAERELAALNKFAERKRQALSHAAQRRDQKHNDEMAANAHRRQANTPNWRP